MKEIILLLIAAFIIQFTTAGCENDEETETTESTGILNESAELNLITDGFEFAEGPAYNSEYLFFSDIGANTIYKWSEEDGISAFNSNSGGANGLYFDNTGNLYACEGAAKQVVIYEITGQKQILASEFNGVPLNEPNDLWIAQNGNVYFSDPVYTGTLTQDGEHVYCVSSSNGEISRVADDLIRPNGIVGNDEGTVLYITDHGAGKTYRYTIEFNGSLSNKELFVSVGADGLTIDNEGNVYLASNDILVYNSTGELIETINVPGTLTNLCFGGVEGKTLFITTHDALYSLDMNVQGN